MTVLDKRKTELIGEIIKKAYKVNALTRNNVFVSFHGHVSQLEVSIYYDGWSRFRDAEYCMSTYLTDSNALSKMKYALNKLDRLLKES